jgi:hypothetical protein
VLQALKGIPPGERIAIYALGRKLQVIGEFTTDFGATQSDPVVPS